MTATVYTQSVHPADTKRWPGDVLRLDQRLRRWPNLKTSSGRRLVCCLEYIAWNDSVLTSFSENKSYL